MLGPDQIAWHVGQFTEPKRAISHLRDFVTRVFADAQDVTDVLDAATGAGANMVELSDLFPAAHWTGIDLDGELIGQGQERIDPTRFTLTQADMLNLEADFGAKRFDVSFSIMTLSWIEDYERAIEQLVATTRRYVFILNLFSESVLDALVRLVGRMARAQRGYSSYYNIYSLPRFEEFCSTLGAVEIVAEPFEIDIDIPRPDHCGMGTWTERTADGRRLQFSGPLAMPWWFVAIKLNRASDTLAPAALPPP
jgi:hypothetical protein